MKKTLTTRLLALLLCVATLATVTPLFAAAEITITSIDITNADVTPCIGEKAGDWLDYTLPENCHFTMAKHYWYNETAESSMKADEVFAAGSKYDLCWRCEAESGYTFSAGTTVTINGSTALLDDSFTEVDGGDPTVFLVWTKPTEAVEKSATVIDKIEITDADITAVIGDKVGDHLAYTLPENRHFTVDDHFWYNETDANGLIATDTFEADISYQVGWWLIADEGYVFAENPTITINGQTDIDWGYTYRGDTVYTNGENKFFVWTKPTEAVEKSAANVINKIEITDVDSLPIIGEKANDHIDYTFSENCHFTAAKHGWYDRTAYEWVDGADDTFVAGHIYQVGWWLDADEGYTFAEDPTITINGGENINWEYTYIDEENPMRFYVWSEPTEAVEKPADIEITEITITDADITPIPGEKAGNHLAYTLPDDCHFTVNLHYWNNENSGANLDLNDTFAEGTIYDVGWVLKADKGYVFAENATITINGQTDILNDVYTRINGGDNTIFSVWTKATEAVEPIVIDKIEINGFCDPVVGGKAGDYNHLTLPEDAPYHFDAGDPRWYNDTDDAGMDYYDAFEAGKSYSLGGWLIADEGYVFAADAEVLLNGGEYPFDESCTEVDGIDATCFYVWGVSKEAVEPIVIDTIEINGFSDPVAGGKVGDYLNITIPEDAHFSFLGTGMHWYDDAADNFIYDAEALFKAGKSYSIGGELVADPGYVFAENPTVLLNGGAYPVDTDHSFTYIGSPRSFKLWTASKKATAPTEPTEPKPTTEPTATKAPTATEPKATTEPTVKPTESKATVAPTESQPTATEPVIEPTATEPVIEPTATATGTDVPSFILYGDANDDGVVNMKDVLAVRKYVASLPITINMLTADANADGVVNMKDVLAIRKYIAGLVDHLGA